LSCLSVFCGYFRELLSRFADVREIFGVPKRNFSLSSGYVVCLFVCFFQVHTGVSDSKGVWVPAPEGDNSCRSLMTSRSVIFNTVCMLR